MHEPPSIAVHACMQVVPVTERMLFESVDETIWAPEVDWSAPRPEAWIRGGGWGSQRVVLFSGLP